MNENSTLTNLMPLLPDYIYHWETGLPCFVFHITDLKREGPLAIMIANRWFVRESDGSLHIPSNPESQGYKDTYSASWGLLESQGWSYWETSTSSRKNSLELLASDISDIDLEIEILNDELSDLEIEIKLAEDSGEYYSLSKEANSIRKKISDLNKKLQEAKQTHSQLSSVK